MEHEDVLGKTSFHQCDFTFLELLALDSDLMGDEVLSFDNQGFGVKEILVHDFEVLFGLFLGLSLFLS